MSSKFLIRSEINQIYCEAQLVFWWFGAALFPWMSDKNRWKSDWGNILILENNLVLDYADNLRVPQIFQHNNDRNIHFESLSYGWNLLSGQPKVVSSIRKSLSDHKVGSSIKDEQKWGMGDFLISWSAFSSYQKAKCHKCQI